MNKKIISILIVSVLCLALLAVGCSKTGKSSEKDEIVIGAACSLTGMFAGFGEGSKYGLEAAIEDINKQGGVYVEEYGKKLPLRIIVRNSESDPIKVGALMEDLVLNDKVDLLCMGGEPPTTTSSASNVADKYKIPFVSCCGPWEPWKAMKDAAPGHWDWTFACGTFAIASPAEEGDFRGVPGYTVFDAWASQLKMFGDQTNKKMAVFASDDPDGIGWYGVFPSIVPDLGYDVVGLDKKLGLAPMETTDFSSIINEWKAEDCQIVWGNAPAPFIATLWKQCRQLGFKPKIATLGRGSLFLEDVQAWGGNLPLGVGTEIYWHPAWEDSPGIGGETPQSIHDRWHEDTGRGINSGMADGYRTMQVIIDSIERAGTVTDKAKLRDALWATDLPTVIHRVKGNSANFSRGALVYGQWQGSDGNWTLEVVHSYVDFVKPTADPIFPLRYD